MNRRDFFKSFSLRMKSEEEEKGEEPPEKSPAIIRPPYNGDPELFQQKCPTCPAYCMTACEEGIIRLDKDSIPYLDFSVTGCTFCGDCAKYCNIDVLKIDGPATIHWLAELDKVKCSSWTEPTCRMCADVCETKAILFYGGLRPEVDGEACTGCGQCTSYCPDSALTMIYSP
ncbi:MAG TPA: ferredoxin-type protein NapF [Spirochaetes bacterium]|nr:ferredoxin-type protein NapF [Spirochaetota bacterium]